MSNQIRTRKKIALLLSGGVDSSTALKLLADAGQFELEAHYLKIWLEDDLQSLGSCPWEEDLSFATAVCASENVPLAVNSLQNEYHQRVVSYALAELKEGRTPSPDIFCNERVKFGAFFDLVGNDFDKVATGHYAGLYWVPGREPFRSDAKERVDALSDDAGEGEGFWDLHRAPDPVKDQSYFLSHLSQAQLSKIVFPIGQLPKNRVRELARSWDLAPKDRPDSQGICFLGKIRYPEFVRSYLGTRSGEIRNIENGEILGTHEGFWFHTLGQRTGLGLGNGPWYVAAKDVETNTVWVAHARVRSQILVKKLEIENVHWLCGRAPDGDELCDLNKTGIQVKLRHGPQLHAATIAEEGSRYCVTLEEGDGGIAAGQYCVMYSGVRCLGSGRICDPHKNELGELREKALQYEQTRPKVKSKS